LFASHYIVKPPGDGQPVLWHQDAAYWPLDPMEVVTVWLAVDASTPENGCLRIVPGSHLQATGALRSVTDIDNVLSSQTTLAVDENSAVDVVLQPGDVEVHHPNVIHGSGPNLSTRRRAGLTIRYIPTSTRITDPGAGCPILLRGAPVEGVNTYLTRPVFDPERHFPFSDAIAAGARPTA
jgi:ectoine hydroxylase-related dioxygenase (phytanoyl-CoA dioxygenase family)